MRSILPARDVLLAHENMRPIVPALQACHTVHCLWNQPDADAFLAASGAGVGVIVSAGENRIDRSLIDRLPNLGLIICVTAGYDGVDTDYCAARGVAVVAAVGVNADDVADFALGLAIAAWRGIVADDRLVRDGQWQVANRMPQRRSMRGAKAGIVGLGSVGLALAPRLAALGMTVGWWGPRDRADIELPRAESLLALARGSDLLLLCCRADATSRHMVDAQILEALGPDGMLVNVSRGSVVDETALIDALRSGAIGGAALDVFETEPTPAPRWTDVPNVIVTPHTAGVTRDVVKAMILRAVERVGIFLGSDEDRRRDLLRENVAVRAPETAGAARR